MMVPTGNLPQSTAGRGFPLKVAPVIERPATGAVLSIHTVTSCTPGNSVVGEVFGFFAVTRIFQRPSNAAVVCQRPSVLVTRCRVWGAVVSSRYVYQPSP